MAQKKKQGYIGKKVETISKELKKPNPRANYVLITLEKDMFEDKEREYELRREGKRYLTTKERVDEVKRNATMFIFQRMRVAKEHAVENTKATKEPTKIAEESEVMGTSATPENPREL